jgi:cyclopropane-fatty-acyl-phospholipid synthase
MAKASAPFADRVAPLLRALVDEEAFDPSSGAVALRAADGSRIGPEQARATIVVRDPVVLRHLLYAPGELGLARAYVSGALDLEGDVFAALSLREHLRTEPSELARSWRSRARLAGALLRLGALGPPPPVPPEEARLSGRRHSRRRDAAAIAHHYDVSNDFYRLVLGPSMTYSCAYFATPAASLEEAQCAKHELVCRKLGLEPGMRLLDVGCGWGSMAIHAAARHGVRAVGVTISAAQLRAARERVAAAGLEDRVEIRLQDYRDVDDGPYDAICSIGMFEHVGLARLREYFSVLARLLRPGGRLLNHGISRPGHLPPARAGGRAAWRRRSGFPRRSFVDRYVFPDGELHEVGTVVTTMQACGLEVRDVESLREHYARTLRAWVANLENDWERAAALVGDARARVWRLYMAASALNFAANRTSVHQVLACRTAPDGTSGFPPTRADLLASLADDGHPEGIAEALGALGASTGGT